MTEINHHLRTVKESLSTTYKVPFYQRDYRWKRKQFEDLLTDLQDEFLPQFDISHSRDQVAQYKSYFLGTILTTKDEETSRKIIVDGQQRLTSLTLFFIYILRTRLNTPNLKITNFESLIKTESFGENVLNFESDDNRAKLISYLLSNKIVDDNLEELDFLDESDEGTKNVYARFKDIEDILDDKIKNHLAYFADWVANKVVLFEIVVPTEHDAHKVFVTMNDRGLNLSPLEMLKGFILSQITNPIKHKTAHSLWQERIKDLKKNNIEDDSNFIRTWLRAKYANSIRGKSKDETKMDFENIGDSYHRWLDDNRVIIGLQNGNDYEDFILEKFKRFSDIYLRLQQYSQKSTDGFEYVFYNASNDLTLQHMVILAAIKHNDPETIVDQKINLVARYLDYLISVRILNLRKNTYDNLRDLLFLLAKDIRDKNIKEIKQIFEDHAKGLDYKLLSNIDSFTYDKSSTKNILYILARIASFLEKEAEQTSVVNFHNYVDRRRGSKTFDIEHILAADYNVFVNSLNNPSEDDFNGVLEFESLRNRLGGLILLPRSKNRSLQDKPFSEKISKYISENILAQTLCSNYYENNPPLKKFIEVSNLEFNAYEVFKRSSILERQELYKSIISMIWGLQTVLNE